MEYEKREIIPFETKIINNDYIEITTSVTNYSRRKNIELIELNEFLDKLKIARKLSKEQGVKIKGINKLSKKIKNDYEKYATEVNTYRDKFYKLGKGWDNHVLHLGISEDTFYTDYLRVLEYDLQKMSHRPTQLSQYRDIYNNINKIIDKLENGNLISATVYH